LTPSRSQLARKLVEEWGVSLTEAGRHLGVSPSAIAKTLYRLNSHKSN
jgi:predicted transcriptional regulator